MVPTADFDSGPPAKLTSPQLLGGRGLWDEDLRQQSGGGVVEALCVWTI